ncbi:unnamed protein product [Phytophthora lilii]|uniref:Unnamed protein product n=1 Tax=Phytophthora lilii TaxID=2077276 RepID=A0A9W6TB12_9STRA|nr:unnamed protein product [Phytophthora lilii]
MMLLALEEGGYVLLKVVSGTGGFEGTIRCSGLYVYGADNFQLDAAARTWPRSATTSRRPSAGDDRSSARSPRRWPTSRTVSAKSHAAAAAAAAAASCCHCRAHVIRDLNDEINKRIREKRHWERRIVQLGGQDYSRSQPQTYDADGVAVRGVGGYKYFGAAKNLPGVRELFEKEEPEPRKRTRQDMYKHIEPDYYGFRDDEDEQQLEDEAAAEKRLKQRAMEGWDAAEAKRKAQVAELVRRKSIVDA